MDSLSCILLLHQLQLSLECVLSTLRQNMKTFVQQNDAWLLPSMFIMLLQSLVKETFMCIRDCHSWENSHLLWMKCLLSSSD